jgi:ubiquinone/menaquinone biosynthesis C-methylase UbiE
MQDSISSFYRKYYHEDIANAYMLGEVLRFVPDLSCRILDVGCGTGSKSKYFKKKSNVVVGADISASQIEKAQENLNHVIIANVNDHLPFKKKEFDIVYCANVLEHIFDFTAALREMKRVLKSEGRIIIEVPNVNYWPNRILMLLGKELIWIGVGKHIRAFSKSNLKRSLVRVGFNDVKVFGSILPIPKTKLKIHFPYFNRILPGLCFSLIGIGAK